MTLGLACLAFVPAAGQAVDLADAPLFSTVVVPGNLALALSVEWPTASTPAYPKDLAYSTKLTFLGYFDHLKCYQYKYNKENSYFAPNGYASDHTCASSEKQPLWSGNFLNWVALQTLDSFRWVLTGGYRSVDTDTTTILTKTYHATTSSNKTPNKAVSNSDIITGATPFKWKAWASRTRNLGTAVYFTNSGNVNNPSEVVDYDAQNSYAEKSSSAFDNEGSVYKIYINVKVCDASVGLEDNCVAYGSNSKPEGLLQKYSSKLRYSAFGYLNDSTATRDGAVLRARMKYIGPTKAVPGSTPVSNSAAEWDGSTGVILINPDSSDAEDTVNNAKSAGRTVAVPNSGIMNYLNKFGNFPTPTKTDRYKSYDPVNELYYATTRYFRNLGNVAAYSDISGAGDDNTANAWLDYFPVITNWGDPILYACQKNFILGIGDTNPHDDGNLPGSTLRSSDEPTLETEVSNDKTVDVKKATDEVGILEGTSNLGSTWSDKGRGESYYMAGLAYAAHTQDIRSDLDGIQTINTYWVDVMENAEYLHKNKYLLAAKYGGFSVPDGFTTYDTNHNTTTLSPDSWRTTSDELPPSGITRVGSTASYSTDKDKDNNAIPDKRPDNYLPANLPSRMKESLETAFEKIVSEASATTSTALATKDDKSGENYPVAYDPVTWTSILKGQLVAYASDGTATPSDIWNATTLLDARKSANRLIVTCCKNSGEALPFTETQLSNAELSTRTYYKSFEAVGGVDSSKQSIANYIDYLRGSHDRELANGGPYRNRKHLLGDVVNAKVKAVGPPNFPYYEIYNPGYSAFKAAHATRPTVLYVGANDGMMHAFDGTLPASADSACTSALTTPTTDCGKELFAYIPSFVYGTSSTAAISGLASLGNPSSFSHHFLVDATPVTADVNFYKTPDTEATAADWRTLLVGGLGKGGKGYYAIDITDPASWTSEANVASKVLWEFTHTHMGYSYGNAIIVKTPEFGWTVIVPSGYNNDDGKGYLFFLNPRTGALLKAVSTPEGSTDNPINLAQAEAYVPNVTHGVADAIYAGDLRGNVWRIDLTATTTSSSGTSALSYDYAILKLANLTDSNNVGQPITTQPLIQPDPSSGKRYLLIGTGQLLADSDVASKQQQSFYAINDGTADYGGFYAAPAQQSGSSSLTTTRSGRPLPDSISFPITRSVLAENSDFLTGIANKVSATKPMGWYFDLPTAASNKIAERVNVRPAIFNGFVAFAGNLPNGDSCSPAGTADLYTVTFADGLTALTGSSRNAIALIHLKSSVTDINIHSTGTGGVVITGNTQGEISPQGKELTGPTIYRRFNWREVPTVD